MSEHQYDLAEDEKVTPVMAYTATSMFWGDAITKKMVRVGGWMRSDFSPLILELHNAQTLIFSANGPMTLSYPVIYLPYDTITAFHVMPGVEETLYYDPNEKKRVMLPVSAFIGQFRFEGKTRISEMTKVLTTLEIAKEDFLPVFEVEVSHPSLPPDGVIKVEFATVKRTLAVWGIPDSPERDYMWSK
ncbi:hypothetical protein QUF64_00235 [Anaerolineales bacterium HSG6]|nr:hypothetical protein [Anaerolineales bacterium HSG6]MDM8531731.1 hypothetical protein [Anaerolineales bacterium HSG25]